MSENQYNPRMLAAKARLLERFRKKGPSAPVAEGSRVPPGQHLTGGFPVLDLGIHPRFHERRWHFQVEGEVTSPIDVDWAGFQALLPRVEQVADFHCVTTWSKLDVRWGGIRFIDLAALVEPTDAARFVIMHCADGYTTNLPLADLLDDNVILACELEGQPMPVEHGGPMRLVVPKLYAWKSAKFLQRLVFQAEDEPGFWEQRGYHMRGDPWKEERHG
ncbi:MAG: sulfite oxidase-like oxidoreductase [Gemmatimonadota bacterium]